MWADTLLAAEGAHLLRLLLWGAASLFVGTGLLAWLRFGARRSALLSAAWPGGTAALLLASRRPQRLPLHIRLCGILRHCPDTDRLVGYVCS